MLNPAGGKDPMVIEYTSRSEKETLNLGRFLGRLAEAGDIICLNGELGTGKTVLARGVASGLGVKGRVASPTFTLINEHRGRVPFYHMDVYRLGSPGEMEDLGYEEYFYGRGVTLVEWANLVSDVLPQERLDVYFLPSGEEARMITLTSRGERYHRLLKEMKSLVRSGN